MQRQFIERAKISARFSICLFILSFLGFFLPSGAAGQLVALPGKFNVKPDGEASFSIPISIPPGTGGLVPSLSINYTSGGGDGLLGVGWGIDGLSTITRCPQTQAQDGSIGSVTYDVGLSGPPDNDRFCLDGQRLIALLGGSYGAGSYGASGTQYRTEIESFSKIISYGQVGAGPAYFDVQTKTGLTLEYGNTLTSPNTTISNNSAVLVSGSVADWLLDKVTDTNGNYMIIKYEAGTGEAIPSEIDYTGNPGGTGSDGKVYPAVQSYNKVLFVYGSRTDVIPRYTDGTLVETTQLLTNIETFWGTQAAPYSTEVNDYKFGYATSPSTGRSILTSIQLCDNSGSNCLPIRTFGYQQSAQPETFSVNTNYAGANGSYNGYQIYPGDFAGAGVEGALLVQGKNGTLSGSLSMLLNKGGILTQVPVTNAGGTALSSQVQGYNFVFGDFNGDGKEDIFWYYYNTSSDTITSDYLWLGNGNGSFNVVSNPIQLSSLGYFDKALAGDFNGNGKDGLFFYFGYAGSLLGSTIGDVIIGSTDISSGDENPFYVADYETSMALANSNCVSQSNCTFANLQVQNWTPAPGVDTAPTGFQPYVVDLNGDGKDDLYFEPEDVDHRVSDVDTVEPADEFKGIVWYSPITFSTSGNDANNDLSSGSVSSATATIPLDGSTSSLASVYGDRPLFGDYNGDGLPDIFWDSEDTYNRSTGATDYIWLNKGNSSFVQTAISSQAIGYQAPVGFKPYAADFSGEGMTDILWDDEGTDGGTNGSRTLWRSTGSGFSTTAYGATTNLAGQNGNLADSGQNYASTSFHPIIIDGNGDGKADILWDDHNINDASQGTRELWTSDGIQPDLLSNFQNGLGSSSANTAQTEPLISYGTSAEGWGSYYSGWDTTTCSATLPAPSNAVDISLPTPIVISASSNTGTGSTATYTSSYRYSCLRTDATGRGLLGFAQQIVTEPSTVANASGIVQTTDFLQNFPDIGLISLQIKTITIGTTTVTLSSTANTYGVLTPTSSSVQLPWSGPGAPAEVAPQFPYVATSVVSSTDLNGAVLPTATTTTAYNAYGEATSINTQKSDGSEQTTANQYNADNTTSPHWWLGRLTQSIVTSTTP